MNQISLLTTETTRADFALAHQSQLQQLLIRYFPTDYHSLFAIPKKISNENIEWYSPITGEAIALTQLQGQEKNEIRQTLDELLHNIKAQAAIFASQNTITDDERHILDIASTLPDDESVYIINGKPIITWWPRNTPLAPSVAQITAGASAAAAGAALANISPKTRKRWARWLLLLILLIVVVLIISWRNGSFKTKTSTTAHDHQTNVELSTTPTSGTTLRKE